MRISLLPGLIIKALLYLLPHWISSTHSTLSYLISLRFPLYPPTYVQISHMESLPWRFLCNISYKLSFSRILLVHILSSPYEDWLSVYTMELFITYFFSVYLQQMTELYHTFSYIQVKWIIFRRSYIHAWILAFMSVSFLHKYRLTCYW
jgi:hypothetical protein